MAWLWKYGRRSKYRLPFSICFTALLGKQNILKDFFLFIFFSITSQGHTVVFRQVEEQTRVSTHKESVRWRSRADTELNIFVLGEK